MHHLFVYGTLMRGDQNHEAYLKNERFIAKGALADYGLYELGSYPGIVEKSGETVKGEVYLVSENTLQRIDDYEDEGILYRRQEVDVILEGGERLRALTYVYLQKVNERNRIPFERQPWRAGIK